VDVPSTATARVRELSRGGRRKNDVIDAAAAASVAALSADGAPLAAQGATTVLAMLDERRNNVVAHRTRLSTSSTRCCGTWCRVGPRRTSPRRRRDCWPLCDQPGPSSRPVNGCAVP
jgi:hypothetical protein